MDIVYLVIVFENYKKRKETKKHPVDKSGKSTVTTIYYDFDGGDLVALQCYDMSKKSNYPSGLKIQFAEKEFVDWMYHKAYK